ncbi:MAG: hypothetical protein M3384_14945 [Acidobacteriota bacterium]|nr:hypothetical protein [Acidobacteriota bacterium]
MKTYVDYSYAQEFDVTSTLYLEDDGRFSYSEYSSCYGAAFSGSVSGTWRRSGDTLFLLTEQVGEHMNSYEWVIGQERQVIEQGDKLIGDGFSMYLQRDEPVQAAQQTEDEELTKPIFTEEEEEEEEAVQPDDVNKRKNQVSTVVNLHFKDGRIQQRQLTNSPFFGLFDEMFYRLVDENGNVTNMFKRRQNSEHFDSPVSVEYDEIDFNPTVETGDFES